MTTRIFKTVMVFVIGAALGGMASGLYSRRLIESTLSDSILDSSSTEIVEAASTLTLMREQKYSELMKSKEEALNSQIYSLSFLPLTTNGKELNIYRMAARYRQNYPYESGDSNVDQSVKDFLAKVR